MANKSGKELIELKAQQDVVEDIINDTCITINQWDNYFPEVRIDDRRNIERKHSENIIHKLKAIWKKLGATE